MTEQTDDRELLEKAARAAGVEGTYVCDALRESDCGRWKWTVTGIGDDEQPWNPLADDGDALRLAVKLNLDILQDPASSRSNAVEVIANEPADQETKAWAFEVRAPSPYAATRRAIVRAAASMAGAA